MPSPFPGMNPYLENPELWGEFQFWLTVALTDAIFPHVRPKYRVAIQKREYQFIDEHLELSNIAVASSATQPITVNIPIPEEVRESYLEVREVGTGEVVTVIELLSPKNKRPGEGRKAYKTKRQQVFGSSTHLVEIDLLRGGEPMQILGDQIQSDYRILVSRSELRPQAELYPFNLREQIPTFVLPLRKGDTEPLVDLQSVIQDLFDRAGFDLAIDYSREPVPPIGEDDIIWVSDLLKG